MERVKANTANLMTKRFFELKEILGDIQSRVKHPDIGLDVIEEDYKEDLNEEFNDYLGQLSKDWYPPVEEREGEFSDTFRQYIGIVPIISVKKPKDKILQKDIYSQYRK